MKFSIFAWVADLWRRLWPTKCSVQPGDPEYWMSEEFHTLMKVEGERMKREFEEQEKAIHEAALAAAATGEGPQPWDRDWYERSTDFYEEVISMAQWGGWHYVQEFIEVLDWALASPQGQQAQELAGKPSNPWQGELDLITQMRRDLVHVTQTLLEEQAEKLHYTMEWEDALDAAWRSAD